MISEVSEVNKEKRLLLQWRVCKGALSAYVVQILFLFPSPEKLYCILASESKNGRYFPDKTGRNCLRQS